MATRSILLAVADPQTLIDINRTLGLEWETTSVATEAEALGQLEQRAFDALLVDFNLGTPDASELLNQALEKRPETTRFLLAYEADLALVAAKVRGSHQILPKPIEAASLKSRIEDGAGDSNSNQRGDNLAAEVGAPPTIPPVFSEVLEALDSPGVTKKRVGEIIATDAGLTAEVLRLTRSAYLGLPRNLTEPAEAVESLGLVTIKALVMARRFLAEHSHIKPCYLSLDQLWQHSTKVAHIARDLVLFETMDRRLASQALAAGLVHDLGKVVLVTNFGDLYGRVHSLARKQPVALWDIEKEMFGANHGEIGACLVGMWNLPSCIVEAAAFHHEPPLGEQEHLTPLAAVHIANVLEHQLRPSDEFRVAPIINTVFLNQLGLLDRLPVWHAAYANRGTASEQSRHKPAETEQSEAATAFREDTRLSRTANALPGPSAATGTATSEPPTEDSRKARRSWQSRWAYAGLAAGVLFLLALWLRTQPSLDESTPIYARTPVTSQSDEIVSSTQPLEAVPATTPEVTPTTPVSDAASTTNASSVPNVQASQATPEPTPAMVSHATAANVPPPGLTPKESAPPEFRLTGIIYAIDRPSAILNGKTVYVGDQLRGATVISIGPSDVALEIQGRRRTCTLR